jgi:hypothetical protein
LGTIDKSQTNAFNIKTSQWAGKCAQCGASAKIEMELETPQKSGT